MRLLGRLLLYLLLAMGVARMVLYFVYAAALLPTPLEAFDLEAKMVLLAWRVQRGLSLYPAWWDYPHVSNFYGPVVFVLEGLLGRLFDADVRGLFLIGRAVSFASSLLTTLVVGVWIGRRYGRGAGLAGGVLSLGSRPMYGFTVMARPDAPAELLGVAGFFLSGSRSRRGRLAGVALLILAALTKQTAGLFLVLAALATALEGERRRALCMLGGGLAGLLLLVVAINSLAEPYFVVSLLGESAAPWDFATWRMMLLRVAEASPDLLFMPVVGLVLWIGGRPRDLRAATLTVGLLAFALGLSGKVGADVNYYLSLRVAEAIAVGTLWHAVHAVAGRSTARRALLAATAATAVVLQGPGLLAATSNAVLAWQRHMFFESPAGHALLLGYRGAIARARDPDFHLLTDLSLIDLYRGERAEFGDPFLFRNLVESGKIRPKTMLDRIESQYYDMIISSGDLNDPRYGSRGFRLPMILAERARVRYVLEEVRPWLFIYGRRVGGRSAVAEQAGVLAR
jgi:hypothetical protein